MLSNFPCPADQAPAPGFFIVVRTCLYALTPPPPPRPAHFSTGSSSAHPVPSSPPSRGLCFASTPPPLCSALAAPSSSAPLRRRVSSSGCKSLHKFCAQVLCADLCAKSPCGKSPRARLARRPSSTDRLAWQDVLRILSVQHCQLTGRSKFQGGPNFVRDLAGAVSAFGREARFARQGGQAQPLQETGGNCSLATRLAAAEARLREVATSGLPLSSTFGLRRANAGAQDPSLHLKALSPINAARNVRGLASTCAQDCQAGLSVEAASANLIHPVFFPNPYPFQARKGLPNKSYKG